MKSSEDTVAAANNQKRRETRVDDGDRRMIDDTATKYI